MRAGVRSVWYLRFSASSTCLLNICSIFLFLLFWSLPSWWFMFLTVLASRVFICRRLQSADGAERLQVGWVTCGCGSSTRNCFQICCLYDFREKARTVLDFLGMGKAARSCLSPHFEVVSEELWIKNLISMFVTCLISGLVRKTLDKSQFGLNNFGLNVRPC